MPRGTVEIIDVGGWCKTYPLDKNIIHIGSDARNDIAIESFHGAGLAVRHVQLITSPTSAQGYRLINIGPVELRSGEGDGRLIAPHSAIDLVNGEVIKLGDFTFIFRRAIPGPIQPGPIQPGPIQSGPIQPGPIQPGPIQPGAISATLNLPQTQLAPEQVIDGSITLKNLGDKPGVQFKLEVDGLNANCYEIGPGPILFPNAELQVMFRVRHPMQPTPPAGEHLFTIRVTAPGAYSDDMAIVHGAITLQPFFKHELKLSFTEK